VIKRPMAAITGASSGIGAEFARQLAARGYDLLLIARREDRLRSLSAELAAGPHAVTAEILVADLTVDDDRARAAVHLAEAENLALLVNNAGFGGQGAFDSVDLDSQNRMQRLHILTTLDLTHAALRNLKSRSAGSAPRGIINVSSVAGFAQAPFNVSYCASKAWINSFVKGLSMELAAEGSSLRVQALCPGFTYSEFHDRLMARHTIPARFWMSAQFVVSDSLRGFDRGTVCVIPGWQYRWIVRAIGIIPSPWMRWISTRYARKRHDRASALQGS
jgi:uncharacterized protein